MWNNNNNWKKRWTGGRCLFFLQRRRKILLFTAFHLLLVSSFFTIFSTSTRIYAHIHTHAHIHPHTHTHFIRLRTLHCVSCKSAKEAGGGRLVRCAPKTKKEVEERNSRCERPKPLPHTYFTQHARTHTGTHTHSSLFRTVTKHFYTAKVSFVRSPLHSLLFAGNDGRILFISTKVAEEIFTSFSLQCLFQRRQPSATSAYLVHDKCAHYVEYESDSRHTTANTHRYRRESDFSYGRLSSFPPPSLSLFHFLESPFMHATNHYSTRKMYSLAFSLPRVKRFTPAIDCRCEEESALLPFSRPDSHLLVASRIHWLPQQLVHSIFPTRRPKTTAMFKIKFCTCYWHCVHMQGTTTELVMCKLKQKGKTMHELMLGRGFYWNRLFRRGVALVVFVGGWWQQISARTSFAFYT